jgi:CDP-diacylglycerol pyrophosphatase
MGSAARHLPRAAALVLLAFLAWGCATVAPPLPAPPVHPDGLTLWNILHERCVPDQVQRASPAPCAVVSLTPDEARGFVVLKDRNGIAQHLLMPTARITGIEDPLVLQPGAPNYFALAWSQRGLLEQRLGHSLGASQTVVTVNSIYGRSQDQLHLHIDCLGALSTATLAALGEPARRWSSPPVTLKGQTYLIRWVDAAELASTSPFQMLAHGLSVPPAEMGAWTLALVGAHKGARDGFYLLAQHYDPVRGQKASAEDLQDHDCRP